MELQFHNISKKYKSAFALDNFTITMKPGIYAILGPNGSGKSTLMNIIAGNLRADTGSIIFSPGNHISEDISKMGIRFLEKIGFMPQYPGMYSFFTIRDFMWYMATLKNLEKNTADKQIQEILRSVELYEQYNQKIGSLSGGMKQRLALAQAILGYPDILLLDEPTAGLDPKQRISIRNYISRIAFNKIVLIATHIVSDIEFIARDVIMLKKGIIVEHAPPHVLTEKIAGSVWIVPCTEADVQTLQNQFHVTHISRDEATEEILLRVLSPNRPTGNAKNTAPTLEDYYLYIFGQDAVNEL